MRGHLERAVAPNETSLSDAEGEEVPLPDSPPVCPPPVCHTDSASMEGMSRRGRSVRGGRSRRRERIILARLMGGESLTAICRERGFPAYRTVRRWIANDAEFRARYARARTLQAHALVDDMLDTVRNPDFTAPDKQVRLRGLTWAAARLHPARYGDRALPESAQTGPVFTVILPPSSGDGGA